MTQTALAVLLERVKRLEKIATAIPVLTERIAALEQRCASLEKAWRVKRGDGLRRKEPQKPQPWKQRRKAYLTAHYERKRS